MLVDHRKKITRCDDVGGGDVRRLKKRKEKKNLLPGLKQSKLLH